MIFMHPTHHKYMRKGAEEQKNISKTTDTHFIYTILTNAMLVAMQT